MKTIALAAIVFSATIAFPTSGQEFGTGPINLPAPVVYTAPVVYEGPVIYNAPVVYQAPVVYGNPTQYAAQPTAPVMYEVEPGVFLYSPNVIIIGERLDYDPAFYPDFYYGAPTVIPFGRRQACQQGYNFTHPR